jgi:hypothetical protein
MGCTDSSSEKHPPSTMDDELRERELRNQKDIDVRKFVWIT